MGTQHSTTTPASSFKNSFPRSPRNARSPGRGQAIAGDGEIFWGGPLGRTPGEGWTPGEDSRGLLGRTPGVDSWWRQGSSRVVVRVVVFLFKKEKNLFPF